MKPKDLLEYLEKGDRSMEHLKGKVDQKYEVPGMNALFQQAYSDLINAQLVGGVQSTQQALGQAQLQGAQIGGVIRW